MTELITVVIPVRNGAQTITRAVESAVEAGAHEVLVYDDASTDGTGAVLDTLFLKYAEVGMRRVPMCVKAGVNFARNYLIERATSELIVCLDADDTLHPLHPLLDAYEPGTFVYGDYLQYEGGDVTKIKGAPPGSLSRRELTGITFLFAKADWLRCGGFNPDFAYSEDWTFQCNLVHNGVRPKQIDCVVYDRYLHSNGNERTSLAGLYWTFFRDMARMRYPGAFKGTG